MQFYSLLLRLFCCCFCESYSCDWVHRLQCDNHECAFFSVVSKRMKSSSTHSYFIILRALTHLVPLRGVIYKNQHAAYFVQYFFHVVFFSFLFSHKLFNTHFLPLRTYYNCIDQPRRRSLLPSLAKVPANHFGGGK